MDKLLLERLQKRMAGTAVGPATARGMGPAGTIQASRAFLASLDLASVRSKVEWRFRRNLDAATEELQRSLPRGAQHWGSARKFLNIFLRNCLYSRYMAHEYQLDVLEPWLELPLDSHVAKGLRKEEGGRVALPRWKTVVGLDRSTSDQYQQFASQVAAGMNMHRVHLDVVYWRGDHMQKQAAPRLAVRNRRARASDLAR